MQWKLLYENHRNGGKSKWRKLNSKKSYASVENI